MTDETRAKLSAAHLGLKMSPETKAKISASKMGQAHVVSPEVRAKMSMAHTNPSPETRAKISAAHKGHIISPETRAKISMAAMGPLNPHWNGGAIASICRQTIQRRGLGFIPLNQVFVGADGHHINQNEVIYIPHELHESIRHNVWNGRNMDKINAAAFDYLSKQGVAQ